MQATARRGRDHHFGATMDTLTQLVVLSLAAGTPLVYAALGELVVEKSGVLNLGVEGMMLVGAIAAFIVASHSQSPWLGVVAGALAGAALSVIFAIIALTLRANQVATGLALSLFGVGLSAFVGRDYLSVVIDGLKPVAIGGISDIPVVGPLLFAHNPLVYVSIALFAGVAWFLDRTRAGLVLRAVGEAPHSARAIGYPVIAIRYAAVVFGGACAGIGGAYLAIAYTPSWVEGMTAGRGWIALALVVFATWKPSRVLIGAYLFGSVTLAQFQAQAAGIAIPSQLLATLPYVATVIVLAIISRDAATIRLNAPASLGRTYNPE
jgi:simple sugar transport system permease protein